MNCIFVYLSPKRDYEGCMLFNEDLAGEISENVRYR